MRRPSFIFYVLFLGLNYFFGTFWYLILTSIISVGLALAIKRFVFWKYLTLDPPANAAVLITGTSTGIGHGFALRLAQAGVTVIATVRRQEDADKWQKEQPQLAKFVKHVILDVSNEQSIQDAVPVVKEILKKEQKQLYSIINNAGISELSPIELLPREQFDRVIGTNLWGPIAVTKAFLPLLREYTPKGRAKIFFLSSLGVALPIVFNGTYACSKAALECVADVLRVEVKPFGIDVSVIQPGAFGSAIFDKMVSGFKQFSNGQTNNPIFDLYKPIGDKLEHAMDSKFKPTLGPVSILAEELYHALFGRYTTYTIVSSTSAHAFNLKSSNPNYEPGLDAAFVVTLFWLLPESIMTKLAAFFNKQLAR